MERKISPIRTRRMEVLGEAKHTDNRKNEDSIKNNSGSSDGKLNSEQAAAIPHATDYPEMTAYSHMRAMVMAASLPNPPAISSKSTVQDHPFSAGYSDADQDMINSAAKLCGFLPRKLGSRYSEESPEIHRASPTNHNSGKST